MAGEPQSEKLGAAICAPLGRFGGLLARFLGLRLGRPQHDLAVDRQRLQYDVEAFAVLVHERGVNRRPTWTPLRLRSK